MYAARGIVTIPSYFTAAMQNAWVDDCKPGRGWVDSAITTRITAASLSISACASLSVA